MVSSNSNLKMDLLHLFATMSGMELVVFWTEKWAQREGVERLPVLKLLSSCCLRREVPCCLCLSCPEEFLWGKERTGTGGLA